MASIVASASHHTGNDTSFKDREITNKDYTAEHLDSLRMVFVSARQEVVCSGTIDVDDLESSLKLFFENPNQQGVIQSLQFPPKSPDELEPLLSACSPASFGRDDEEVLDPTYRKALRLNTSNFAVNFSPGSFGILNHIWRVLGDQKKMVYARLYKLNVYTEGGFFKAHQDTPRTTNMFGSLVICLPAKHAGGVFVLREGDGKEHKLDWSQNDPSNKCHWVAFYSETTHEVLPVTSGHRITLTYNLFFQESPSAVHQALPDDKVMGHPLYQTLADHLRDPTFLPESGIIIFHLLNSYPMPKRDPWVQHSLKDSFKPHYLKGMDQLVYQIGKSLNLGPRIKTKVRKAHYENEMIFFTAHPWCVHEFGEMSDYDSVEGTLFDNLAGNLGDLVVIVAANNPRWSRNKAKLETKAIPKRRVLWLNSGKAKEIGTHLQKPYAVYGNDLSVHYMYWTGALVMYVGPWDKGKGERERATMVYMDKKRKISEVLEEGEEDEVEEAEEEEDDEELEGDY